MQEDPHFLVNGKIVDTSVTPTQRTPKEVIQLLNGLKKALQVFVKKSKGVLNPKDLLYGTFLRYDASRTGRMNRTSFLSLLNDFKVSPSLISSDLHINAVMKWFDSNGSSCIDYNDVTRQMFGGKDDVVFTETMSSSSSSSSSSLPSLKGLGGRMTSVSSSSSLLLQGSIGGGGIANTLSSARSSLSLLNQIPSGFLQPYTSAVSSVGSLLCDANSVKENPYVTCQQLQALQIPSEFTVKSSTMEKNVEGITSPSALKAQMKQRKNRILLEKIKIEKKLASIEEQRKKILEDHKAKHKEERGRENHVSHSCDSSY
jgi:hypothetical protein